MAAELIFESKNSKIFRDETSEWGIPVVTKMLNREFPSPQMIRHFYNEYEITKGIEVAGVRKALHMGKMQNRHVVVFPYVSGEPVKKYLQKQPVPIDEFLRLGIEIARILGDIHRHNIIHKDVNSHNIILDTETGTVTLIDFGISTRLNLKEQHLGNPEYLEGSLLYISPEQTGRMNRVVDYRTDLYSLGVTFYELLSGQLPFQRNDAMELVHAHLAQKPRIVSSVRPEVPQVLADIIDRLLAKNAEDRYQSAYGLMYDLQYALEMWNQTGRIDYFELRQKDFSGKFQIPQKLYGRDKELQWLMDAFQRVAQGSLETILVSGYSGTGKSALVHEIHRPITARRGYFIEGKFDQFQRSVPYFAIIEAFRGFVSLLLTENEQRLDPIKIAIQQALGAEGRVLTDVLPNLELLIGVQPEVPEVGGTEAQNRFNYIFRRFVQAISGPEHPLVMFIDDLQWADAASLSLLQVLMTDNNTQFLLAVCAYRDNEVSAGHPFITTVAEMEQKGAKVSRLHIGNLAVHDVHQLLSDATALPLERTEPLAQLVYEKTAGNAFFVNQFVKSLDREHLLHFDFDQQRWHWDVAQIRSRNITDNVVELMADKVLELPEATQQILKVAACVGSQFDLDMLAACSGNLPDLNALTAEDSVADTVKNALHPALAEGLVMPVETRFRFVHDRIQQAVYSLIPENERAKLHWQIGDRLLTQIPQEQQENVLFDLVNQLNQGQQLVITPEKRVELAELNLRAGRKAKHAAAFKPASEYLANGIGLLQADHWQNQYDLSLQLFTESAETAYNMGEFEAMTKKIDAVLQNSRELLDTIRPYAIRINAYKAQNKLPEAIDTGLEVLARLGEKFPEKGALPLVMADLLKTKFMLRGKDYAALTQLPAMQNPQKEAALRILNDIASPAYWARPGILPFLIFRMVQLSLRYGNTAISAFGFATYGLLMCGVVGDMKDGYKFGQIGLALLDRFKAKEWLSQIYTPVYALINHWSEHIHKSLDPFLFSYRVGFETGAIEYACININIYCNHIYLSGKPLMRAEEEMKAFSQSMLEYKQETNYNYNEAYRQAALNLLGRAENPTRLIGEAYDEVKMAVQNEERQDRAGTFLIHFHGMMLNYLFHRYDIARQNAEKTRPLLDAVLAKYDVPVFWFYEALISLELARGNGSERNKHLRRANKNIAQFRKWAKFCPENHGHKLQLLLAERAWCEGKADAARRYYDAAIAGAAQQAFLNEEALANERAGLFYQGNGLNSMAEYFLKKAYQSYREWGAVAKLDDMRARYPQLTAALPREKSSNALLDLRTRMETTNIGNENELDLDTVMKASQAISGEIVLERLIRTLLKITIENAGAEKGYLVLEQNGQWYLETENDPGKENDQQSILLKGNQLVPESVVQFVIRTRQSLVLDDARSDSRFTTDPVVLARGLRSVLCLPFLNKGTLTGILYLENSLHSGVFTENRVQFLQLLSGQIAISLENAQLYENLEQKVIARTAEIARQRDLIEQEKQKSDNLLLNILPAETAEELKRLGGAKPRHYDSVTVLFTDFVNFSHASDHLNADELVQEIHYYYSAFDAILSAHNLEKIKTIGDSYMCVGGLPVENERHAIDAVNAALEIQAFIAREAAERQRDGRHWFDCRFGIHSGPVVAGIVGTKKFAYDIWGRTVNIASRMEANSEAGRLNISNSTYELVKDHFTCTYRGKIEAKNTGAIDMYFVTLRDDFFKQV